MVTEAKGSEPSAERLIEAVREGLTAGLPMRVRGAGSKSFLDSAADGVSVSTADGVSISTADGVSISTADGVSISTAEHVGIREYRPEELVVTARAGTPLAELSTALAERHQMLPFEPPEFAGAGTLGGAVASGLSGPGRPWFGAVRDAVLGVVMINGLAEPLRFGGQVMKNVAGYDVARLMCGSGGGLGVLLEVSVRTRPRPETECTLEFEMGRDAALTRVVELGRGSLPVSATRHLGERLALRLSGSSIEVDQAVHALGGEAVEPQVWRTLKDLDEAFFQELGDGRLWCVVGPIAAAYPAVAGDWLTEWGGGRRWLVSTATPANVIDAVRATGGYAICFSSPRDSEPQDPALLAVSERIKAAFDPHGIFAPGLAWSGS